MSANRLRSSRSDDAGGKQRIELADVMRVRCRVAHEHFRHRTHDARQVPLDCGRASRRPMPALRRHMIADREIEQRQIGGRQIDARQLRGNVRNAA
jgi:hypothetical protein